MGNRSSFLKRILPRFSIYFKGRWYNFVLFLFYNRQISVKRIYGYSLSSLKFVFNRPSLLRASILENFRWILYWNYRWDPLRTNLNLRIYSIYIQYQYLRQCYPTREFGLSYQFSTKRFNCSSRKRCSSSKNWINHRINEGVTTTFSISFCQRCNRRLYSLNRQWLMAFIKTPN